jgi:hypothetical protein
MTANELADWIENGAPFGKYETAKQAVAMLRQQQEKLTKYELRNIAQCDRIAILEAQLSEALDAEKDRRFE